jgi:hypothetical protein
MSSLDEMIAKANSTPRNTESADVYIGEDLARFEFTQMTGLEWQELVAAHPRRPTSDVDRLIGFNAATLPLGMPLRYVAQVAGDERLTVTEDQWAALFRVFDGHAVQAIASVLWVLNFAGPRNKVDEAKKALSATKPTKPSSPAKSASPSAGSTGGNRAQRRATTTKKAT